jgi:glycosyltransferase involved in cell wall biosynthesis
MRIGIDYRPALVNGDGKGRYTRELVRGLADLGVDGLRLYGCTATRAAFGPDELGLAPRDPRLLRLRVPSRWMPSLLRMAGRGADDLLGGADLFHHTQYNRLPVRRAREVVTLHDTLFMEYEGITDAEVAGGMTRFARGLAAEAAAVVVPTEHVRRQVEQRLGADPRKVFVTPLGCDHVLRWPRPPAPGPSGAPYVLTISRVDVRKNHPRMLAAFEALARDGLPHRWVVVGAPGYGHEAFERALAASPVADRVRWLRSAGDRELARLLAGASAYLLASLDEGFGITPLEAMALGVPVVTTDVEAVREVVGEAAVLVAPDDVDDVARGLRAVLTDAERARELAARGRARAGAFTWRRTAALTLEAYAHACGPAGTVRAAGGPR